jgi:hypothetical protein
MKQFLSKLAKGGLKMVFAFVLLSAMARFVPSLNWFFFQKNEHNRVFYTLYEMEQRIAAGETTDILVLGSSACEYSLDPRLLADSTGMTVFKMVTGGQTIDMAAKIARHLAPKIKAKYVLIDLYPRFGLGLTEEGVERAIINTPDASSDLTLSILSADPYSPTTNYLWAARAIGTAIAPYPESSMETRSEFRMVAPGFTQSLKGEIAPSGDFAKLELAAGAIACLNALDKELGALGHELVGVVPPIQHGKITLAEPLNFPLLLPSARPDTCFWDAVHMRSACVPAYTREVARLLNQHQSESDSLTASLGSHGNLSQALGN